MTEADVLQLVGIWAGCWGSGYCAGLLLLWFQKLGDML